MHQIDPLISQTLRRQWWWLIGALLLIGCIAGFSLQRQRHAVEAMEKDRLALQARVIDENLSHQLVGVARALEGIQNDIPFWGERPNFDSASRHLQTLSAAMPGVRTLLVLDADGKVVTSDRLELIGKNFSQRDYFRIARTAANPALTTTPAARALLEQGRVDARLLLLLGQQLASAPLSVADFPVGPNETDGVRHLLVLSGYNGADVPADPTATAEATTWLGSQSGEFVPTSVESTPQGLLVTLDLDEPTGLLPGAP